MKKYQPFFFKYLAAMAATLLVTAGPVLAGPPLICHAVDIGTAESLPWTSSGWNLTAQETYDISHLVADTLTLLGPSTPVLVRMETMRRATLYALAAFDFGYLAECYKQASWLHQHTDWLKKTESGEIAMRAKAAISIDGYQWVRKAIALRGSDPQMEFAAALMTTEAPISEHDQHLQHAIAGAKSDAMLARNLASRFPKSAA